MKEWVSMSLPDITEEDIAAVLEVLRSGRLSLGPKTEEFESLIAEYIGTKCAVAVSSGTAALHLLVRTLGTGPGDEVLVPSFTFVASVNAILYERATPVFVDIEPNTYNLDPEDLERKVTPRTRAIMVVDVFGHPAEWDAILEIAKRHNLKVIDDACEALGAEYKGKRVGQFGNAAAFAFYPNKQMTTGEGGVIVTDDFTIAQKCRALRNQGRQKMKAWLEHDDLGYNYRMTEMSAALGISQLRRIEVLLNNRERVAQLYSRYLKGLSVVRPPVVLPHVRMSWFVYVITLGEGFSREPIMEAMAEEGIPTRAYFSPIHLQPYIQKLLKTHEGMLPTTESIAKRTIALPFHGKMAEKEVQTVVEALKEAISKVYGVTR